MDSGSVDLIVTSPPYWKQRDYGHPRQIGQEDSIKGYIDVLAETLDNWSSLLRPHGSVFLNVADKYHNGFLASIPARLERAIVKRGWKIANKVVWSKDTGMPEPKPYRLANRHETIFHFVQQKDYYFDIHTLARHLGQFSNPGDVWELHMARSDSPHLAPFPPDLARYSLLLACPEYVCPECQEPYTRILKPGKELDPSRQQARRAMEIYEESDVLTEEHLDAIRAVGISDAGKGKELQNGAGENSDRVERLAREAKDELGGYFREFTFAPKTHSGWETCECESTAVAGTVLDPFMGSGTTLDVAEEVGRNAIGVDLIIPERFEN